MAVINDGTISLTSGSNVVTGTSTLFLTRAVKSGWTIRPKTIATHLHVLEDAESETSLKLLEEWGGDTETDLEYEILSEFLDYDIPVLSAEGTESAYDINYGHQKIVDALNTLGASPNKYQHVTRIYLGEPQLNDEWGLFKMIPTAQIDALRLSTDDNPPDGGSLVLDMAINGTYQSVNLTVPNNNLYADLTGLSNRVGAGEIVKFKWTSVPAYAGSNWFLDVTWHPVTALVTRYDFTRLWIGELATYATIAKDIGNGYKLPVKSKIFGLYYEFQGNPALGQAIILELYKNGAATGVTFTIPATSLYGYLTCAQTQFLTTDTMTFRVNQVGSDYPGSDMILTALTYQVV